ncbi:MAG TPA: hypothetical protein VMB50_06250 [Myxococcales bacterium]|nr:hypothetical protein [Myxococcales bacterium]
MLASLVLMVAGAQPSPALAAAFAGELRLTLGDDEGLPPPPPPPLVEEPAPPPVAIVPGPPPPGGAYPSPPSQSPLLLEPVPAPPPAPLAGSRATAFWESAGLNLLETGAIDTLAVLLVAEGDLALNPPCGGVGNPSLGIPLLVLGIAAFLAQPFAIAGTTRWIYDTQNYDVSFWGALGGDLLAHLVAGPLVGLLVGAVISAAGGNNAGSAAAVFGVAAFGVVSALGAPIVGSAAGTPAGTPPRPPAHAGSLTVPLVHLAFE